MRIAGIRGPVDRPGQPMTPGLRPHSRLLALLLNGPTGTLALFNLLGGIGLLFSAVLPLSDTTRVDVLAWAAAWALASSAALVILGPRLGGWLAHAALLCDVAAVAGLVAVSQTAVGAVTTGLGIAWLSTIAGYWFPQRLALAYAGLGAAAFGAGLVAAGVPHTLMPWAIVSISAITAAAVLSHLVQRLRAAALTDPLTGLLNRAGLARIVATSPAGRTPLSQPRTLVVIDLDGFKALNDRQGHLAGDHVLQEIGRAWPTVLREGDVAARSGGDEFVLVLPGTDLAATDVVLARLRAATPVRWSWGAALWPTGMPFDEAMARADAELYRCKATRRAPPDG